MATREERLVAFIQALGADISPFTKRLITQLSATAKGWVIRRFSATATAALLELQDENGNPLLVADANGNLYFNPAGSSQANPKQFGFSPAMSAGHAVRLFFGDITNLGIQTGHNAKTQFYGYNDIVIQPGRNSVVVPPFIGAGGPGSALEIAGTDVSRKLVDINVPSGHTQDVQTWTRPGVGNVGIDKDLNLRFKDGGVQTTAQQKVVLTTDRVNNNATANTLADVTGLSFPVEANKHYDFEFVIRYSAAVADTGARFSINGPAGEVGYHTTMTSAAGSGQPGAAVNHYTAYNLPSAAGTFTPYLNGNLCIIRGVISPTAAGTVVARFASEIANSAITVRASRSYVNYSLI